MTWNPTTGCDKISQGCKFCYAEVMSRRLHAMGVEKYKDNFAVREHPEALTDPYKWKKSRVVFVNSMSDLFHPDISVQFIQRVFEVMNDTDHVYQLLTKRSDRLLELDRQGLLNWSYNIWMGVSVENQKVMHRIDDLRQTRAHTRFLSCEPLIGPLPGMNLQGIHWVIVGGESGRKARPMDVDWVLDIQEQCANSCVDPEHNRNLKTKFFFKQWGGTNKKKTGRELNGQTYDEMPSMEGVLRDAGHG